MVPLDGGTEQVVGPIVCLDIGIVVPMIASQGTQAIILGNAIGKARAVGVTITPNIAQIILGSESLCGVEYMLDLHEAGIGDRKLVLVRALGSDEDYTVGTTRTIDSGGCSVFQHVDADNLVSWDVGDGSCGEAIDDEEGLVALRDRTTTTHADGGASTRTTVLRGDHHTGKFALKSLRHVRNGVGHKFLRVNRRNRTGEVAFLDGAVTNDHHFVEFVTIFLDSDAEFTLPGHRDSLFAIADVGHFERGVFGHVRNTEVTIHVGGSTVGGTHDDDVGADDRFAQLIDNGTCYGLGLGNNQHAAERKSHQ